MTLEDSANKKDLTKEILKIGIPSFLETLFTTFVSVIDSKMVSALGVTAISAVSVTNQPRLFVYSIFFAMNTVTTITMMQTRYSPLSALKQSKNILLKKSALFSKHLKTNTHMVSSFAPKASFLPQTVGFTLTTFPKNQTFVWAVPIPLARFA